MIAMILVCRLLVTQCLVSCLTPTTLTGCQYSCYHHILIHCCLTVTLKKGFISQIPILLGLGVGVVFSYALWVPFSANAGGFANYFKNIEVSESVALFDVMPWNTIPAAFKDWPLIGVAIVAIFPIAFATIPESAATQPNRLIC